MDSEIKIFWTNDALINLESILDYLENRWTRKEIDKFKKMLGRQLDLIMKNPKLFPISEHNPRLRKAVLSRQTTIFYELSANKIYLVYLFSNVQDIETIK